MTRHETLNSDTLGAQVFSQTDALLDICQVAGQTALHYWPGQDGGGELRQERKLDGSPVTTADLAVNDVLMSGLASRFPNWRIISEENLQAAKGFDSKQPFWLVDPIDGTKEFIDGHSEFAICIAAVVAGVPRFGLIHAPALDGGTSWMTAKPDVAVRIDRLGKQTEISARAAPKSPIILRSRFHNAGTRVVKLARLLGADAPAPVGAALKFCRLAEGRGDVYARFGSTYEWDLAPGVAILHAAGGHSATFEGTACQFGGAPKFLGPPFYTYGAVAPEGLHDHLCSCLASPT